MIDKIYIYGDVNLTSEIERGKSMLSFYQNIKQTSKGLKKSKFNYV